MSSSTTRGHRTNSVIGNGIAFDATDTLCEHLQPESGASDVNLEGEELDGVLS
jgi:hypothetical protein